ncbi:MAG: hypothetical protein KJP14_11700, partial [Eudoraea sp.]|nr:hypothetical protein [Eudoraea sp.]
MKHCLLLFFMFYGIFLVAQDKPVLLEKPRDSAFRPNKAAQKLPVPPQGAEAEITIKNYKIISHQRDTTFLDTTLTIQKEYRYNYLRQDNFEL